MIKIINKQIIMNKIQYKLMNKKPNKLKMKICKINRNLISNIFF